MNESVLEAIEEHALTPDAVEHVVMLSEQRISVDQRKVLEEQRTDVEKRIQRVVAAIAGDDDVPAAALVAKLRELEARKVALSEELVALRAIPRLAPEVVSDRLNEWRRMLREEVTKARMVLDRVLAGRIVFTPIEDEAFGRGYTFEAPTRFDKLFSGIAVPVPDIWKDEGPVGTEDIRPDETWDVDYGQLLERAARRLTDRTEVASPPGFEPGFQP